MSVPFINHVALPVDDVDRASAFYVDWFGARPIPSPKFRVPVAWLLLGKIQVHLVQHEASQAEPGIPSTAYHFAVAIDDKTTFEELYGRAEREGAFDTSTFQHHIFTLPGGDVQLWVRDPSGNLIEVDYPDVADLDPRIAAATRRWVEDHELSDVNRQASLFRPDQAGIALDGRLASPDTGETVGAAAVEAVRA
jgi:catechol 2,3-dioxygenase-like lactoylglutathione lyase family enzyme